MIDVIFVAKLKKFMVIEKIKAELHWQNEEKNHDNRNYHEIPDEFKSLVRFYDRNMFIQEFQLIFNYFYEILNFLNYH